MSYNKHTWATGNVVGAVDLNRMEQGIEDAGSGQVLVVNVVYDENTSTYTLDKTWQEIYDAFPVVIEYYNENGVDCKRSIRGVEIDNSIYGVDGTMYYTTSSASGYPSIVNEGVPLEPNPGGGTIIV